MVNSLVTSEGLTSAVNMLNSLLQTVTDITSSLGSLGTLGAGVGIFASLKNFGKPKNAWFQNKYAECNMCSLGY